ncbi:MAG: response regulator [Porticoccaceae bacterium]|nr:response regulator [Porticoccaceae bacterium]
MEKLLVTLNKPVTLNATRELRHQLEQLIRASIEEKVLGRRVLLCLSEVLNNLVLHAGPQTRDKGQRAAQNMTLRFTQLQDGWRLEVIDDGDPWDPTLYQPPASDEDPRLRSVGRGIELLRSQCDHLEYWPGGASDHNRLRLSWGETTKSKPSILIVDDDPTLLRLYAAYLAKKYKVGVAASAEQAVEKLKCKKVDLVISDINMPQMSGLGLCEQIHLNRHTETLPFIFLSAYDNTHLQQRANGLGVDDYLCKPVDKHRLTSSIERVLSRSKKIRQQLSKHLNKNITNSLPIRLPRQVHTWELAMAQLNGGTGGGDLLLHKVGESHLRLLLADIMGHDDSAKFFAHACGAYLHGLLQAQEDSTSASPLLEVLSNFALQDQLLSKITLTCCSALLLPEGEIKLAAAGHPPPLLINPEGVTPIATSGMLPGLVKNTEYQDSHVTLHVGERLALYTDGLFDSSADAVVREKNEQAIKTALAATLDLPIEIALNKVMATFQSMTGTDIKDDVLLLLLERSQKDPSPDQNSADKATIVSEQLH